MEGQGLSGEELASWRETQAVDTLRRLESWLTSSLDARPSTVSDLAAIQGRRVAVWRRKAVARRAQSLLTRTWAGYVKGEARDVGAWLLHCIRSRPSVDVDDHHVAAAYDSASSMLTIEHDVPTIEVVPESLSFRYVRARDEVVERPLPTGRRDSLYASLLARIALRVLMCSFVDDDLGHVQAISLSLYVDAIDPSNGRRVRPCLLTLRVTRSVFESIDLEHVDPLTCLRSLHASMSTRPAELVPVRPITTLQMSDARFTIEEDVLSLLDSRPNLMELTPGEFESLITNLFERMGLETRLTRPSRDGGVDCVAFDLRPVLGGKVVIQAKRYKDTVGVSAVRDLYGTVLNEGASKGILVATSGYGPAAFEFADNKPLELVSGANLLALLYDWAGIEAKIEAIDSNSVLPA